ncbi:Homocysteine S-methyltransferase [Corynespora cassiicola Philippines]|uniref:Homocysteine S-methyltransferase n=1 Tax=Corynespora cassiicola Philippines TaxID=1448308 RepID=A0A2T2NAW4_CORCC|nr:Homocysteine S-methyltransferase [Corynespora cassiicola Philippines]
MVPPTPLTSLLSHPTNNTPIILDGALATYLETLGADITTSLWSAQLLSTNPSLIRKAHRDYFLAGANVAITASYQASFPGLMQNLDWSAIPGAETREQREAYAKTLIRTSVEQARAARDEVCGMDAFVAGRDVEAVERTLLVAGSVGPYGAFLADGSEYRGDYVVGKEEMKEFHRTRIQVLVDSGADILACETIPSFAEAEALVELLREEFPAQEAWFSFTLRDGGSISDGTGLEEVVRLLEGCDKVVAVGVNCVPEDTGLAALETLKGLTKKPLVMYPNSGEQWNAQARDWEGHRTEGKQLADRAREWHSAGARLIGGCCRTTPKDIEVIMKALVDAP